MKTLIITALLLSVTVAFAAKGTKGEKVDRQALRAALEALHGFDKNGNKSIDGDEVAAVQKAFAEAPTGALKALDVNHDGKLDDGEIKHADPRGSIMQIVKEIDKDKNHKFEGAEIEALKKKFAADPKAFGRIDHNSNGKLDDDEIAKINERLSERTTRTEKGRASKKAAVSSEAKAAASDTPKAKEGETIKKAEPPTK